MNKLQAIRSKIVKLAEELNREYNFPEFTPLFPNVLVYVLPREQRIGSVWVPDDVKKQNKVTLEGVVLRLWKSPKLIPYCDEHGAEYYNIMETELNIGDHVLFSHYTGVPVSKESKDEFRVIKEEEIVGKVNYEKYEVKEKLLSKIPTEVSDDDAEVLVQKIIEEFIVYPNYSKTLSGV